MHHCGTLISFEGIDGAGKSSHIAPLVPLLQELGHQVTLTREPGGTALAEKLRTLVLTDDMDALTEALLVFAARRDHLRLVIEPALAQGHVVLCDRFTDATFAYQGGGRGFDWAVLSALETWVQALPAHASPQDTVCLRQPDLTVWLDVPPPVAARRLAQARTPDRFEAQPLAFFERVRAGYAQRMAQMPARFVCVDADQAQDVVGAAVQAAVLAAVSVA
jgi:dTMP kinase